MSGLKILRRLTSAIKAKISDCLGNPILYDYQKTIIKLSGLLLVSLFVVVKGSTAPLLCDASWCRIFYSDPGGDKTLYNIGISYIAAFIFYLIQVYLPEKKTCERNIRSFSLAHKHEVYLLNQYLLAWNEFLKDGNFCNFYEFEYRLNNGECGAITKETYAETIDEIKSTLYKIISCTRFQDCDVAYMQFVTDSYYRIASHLKYMDDTFPRWSDDEIIVLDNELIREMILDDMKRIQNSFGYIEHYRIHTVEIKAYSGKSELQKLAEQLL